MLDDIINGAFKANKKQRLSLASNSTPNTAGQGPPSSLPTVPTAMVVADPSTSNASAADRPHPYQLPEMPADMIGGTALNGILPSIFEASIPQVVVKLFHFWGFESELIQIEKMLIKINLVHDDGERKMYINKLVEKWVDDVKETAYEIDVVVEKMNVEVLRLQVESVFDLRKRCSFKRKMFVELKTLVGKLDELSREANGYGLKSRNEYETLPPYWTYRSQTSHSVDVTEIYGRTDDKNRVISYLFDQNMSNKRKYSVIGILGMGGIGKTTLAQLVFCDERVVEKFDFRSWACVSDVFDGMSVLKGLCSFATKKTYDNNMRLAALHDEIENLVRGKRILFVLDDVWTDRDEDWVKLNAPFCECVVGSVILVTTRNQNVLTTMRSREIQKLECLQEVHCWELFKDRAFGQGNMNAELEEMGRKLVQKCRGVPLADKVLSSNIKFLDFKGYGGKRLPTWIFTLHFPSLLYVRMSNMNRLTTVTALTLNSLKSLNIIECPDLREVVIVAPKLRELCVEICPEMIRLSIQACSGTNNSEDASDLTVDPLLHQVALPQTLEHLAISSCEKLGPDEYRGPFASFLPWRINPAAAPPRDQN